MLLLFGMLPLGFDDITITRIEPGRMFREESAMTGMRLWIHHRQLEPIGDMTRVTDEVTSASGMPVALIPGAGALMARVLSGFFAHWHRRLNRALAGSR